MFNALRNGPLFIDDWLDPKIAMQCFEELQGFDIEKHGHGYSDKRFEFNKWTCNDLKVMPVTVRKVIGALDTEIQLKWNYKGDMSLWGAGIHCTKKGGYLAKHRDFNVLPTTYKDLFQKRRVLNVIGYLSKNAMDLGLLKDDGALIWEHRHQHPTLGPVVFDKLIPIRFNRWVFFDPSQIVHGHPYPYDGDIPRWSIALYFYVPGKIPQSEWRGTRYEKLPWMEDSEEYKQARLDRADITKRYKEWLPS